MTLHINFQILRTLNFNDSPQLLEIFTRLQIRAISATRHFDELSESKHGYVINSHASIRTRQFARVNSHASIRTRQFARVNSHASIRTRQFARVNSHASIRTRQFARVN